VTAVAAKAGASVAIKVNGAAHVSGQAATWLVGKNTVEVTVTYGTTVKTYTVIVTKSGTLGELTVASAEGTESGDTAITVTETLTAGCEYKYKTAADVELPELDDDLSDWDDWDGESDITATTGHEIVIAEVSSYDNLCKKAGIDEVVSKA
jgi:hypothetical protein